MLIPRPHQEEAIAATIKGLTTSSRGQTIMACGTGKSLVGQEVATRMESKTILVVVPSLLLVQQMISMYRSQGAINILAVCGDEMRWGEDEMRISLSELTCPSTTSPNEIRRFLLRTGQRVIISTYQSLDLLRGCVFDIAIFDEAHRTAGVRNRQFSYGLSDENIMCNLRLFMTATPKHADLTEEGSLTEVYSMDDEQVYGPVVHRLSLRSAINQGIICDYRVVIATIRDTKEPENREVAIRVALDSMMRKYGVRKIFTYHRTVNDAKSFVEGATETLKHTLLLHINGGHPSSYREEQLSLFSRAKSALISNARCLIEGVDLPNTDAVAYLSTRKSVVDIVQSVGRALRRTSDKTLGYIFLPIILPEKEKDPELAVTRSCFAHVYDVLHALREQDEVFASFLTKGRGETEDGEERMLVESSTDADQLATVNALGKKIQARLLKPFAMSMQDRAKLILEYAKEGMQKLRGTIGKAGPLRSSFYALTSPISWAYNEAFTREFRSLAPFWARGGAQLTEEEAKKVILERNPEVEMVEGTYTGSRNKDRISIRCVKCGYTRNVAWYSAIKKSKCKSCSGFTHEEAVAVLAKKNPGYKLVGRYTKSKNKVEVECVKCHRHYTRKWNYLVKYPCMHCYGHKIKTEAQAKKDLERKRRGIKMVGKYTGSENKVEVECVKCHHRWKTRYSQLLCADTRCRLCAIEERRFSQKEASKLLSTRNKKVRLVGKYTGYKKEVEVECVKCLRRWKVPFNQVVRGTGCRECAFKGMNQFTDKEARAIIARENKTVRMIGFYTGSHKRVEAECVRCGRRWKPIWKNLRRARGCFSCSHKRGERK